MTYEPQKAHNHSTATEDRRSTSGVAREAVQTFQLKANNTGMPDHLKAGIEGLSGMAMDDVKVHYNSEQPSQLQAHAYAQGTDIHIAPGQERHLPHEAWHVVQQKQGRVAATRQLKAGVPVNDDNGLEREADEMGEKALQMKALPEEEMPLQKKGLEEEDLPVQKKKNS
ncbi:eCIS core domain-containing protein [Chitinophaga silvisoli]|uniref:DUF4157 domain-containing protein n=1 Tax=Chitinophaga silvisoli TaxID=2291814 RepID=A0A3E1NWZ9_9BACT|nr:DUF4157 domain-containing protein [Chitinophaga silvisoli]RFM32288.1 DUF4157 domain-containing protein [Chitinophaga silvisoli]